MKTFVKDSWMNPTRGVATVYTANDRVGIVAVEKNLLDGHCKIKVTRQVSSKREKCTRLCVLVCARAFECET